MSQLQYIPSECIIPTRLFFGFLVINFVLATVLIYMYEFYCHTIIYFFFVKPASSAYDFNEQ